MTICCVTADDVSQLSIVKWWGDKLLKRKAYFSSQIFRVSYLWLPKVLAVWQQHVIKSNCSSHGLEMKEKETRVLQSCKWYAPVALRWGLTLGPISYRRLLVLFHGAKLGTSPITYSLWEALEIYPNRSTDDTMCIVCTCLSYDLLRIDAR